MDASFVRRKNVNKKEVIRMAGTSRHKLLKRFNYYNDEVKTLAETIRSRERAMKKEGKKMPLETRLTYVRLNEADHKKIADYIMKATRYFELLAKHDRQ